MKKIISFLSLGLLMILCLTGCVEVNYELTINKDGTATASYLYLYKKEYINNLGIDAGTLFAERKTSAEELKYIVEDFSDDTYVGFKATRNLDNITEGLNMSQAFGEEYIAGEKSNNIGIDGNKYFQNAEIDLTPMEDMTLSDIKMSYTVNLPMKADNSNADVVSDDGKTLTWNLQPGKLNNIKFEATDDSTLIYIIIGGVVAVIGVAVLVVYLIKKNKMKNNI